MTAKPKPERGPASKTPGFYPLKFEEIVRAVLTIKPPEKEKLQRFGRRQDREL